MFSVFLIKWSLKLRMNKVNTMPSEPSNKLNANKNSTSETVKSKKPKEPNKLLLNTRKSALPPEKTIWPTSRPTLTTKSKPKRLLTESLPKDKRKPPLMLPELSNTLLPSKPSMKLKNTLTCSLPVKPLSFKSLLPPPTSSRRVLNWARLLLSLPLLLLSLNSLPRTNPPPISTLMPLRESENSSKRSEMKSMMPSTPTPPKKKTPSLPTKK
mmetsp:Transcript_37014/g.33279  ORF Transcript_37014/g.33279 Transcript_37014/m.33279 type:complete len:212 (+) Transcript_37014:188-823(+)